MRKFATGVFLVPALAAALAPRPLDLDGDAAVGAVDRANP